MNIIVSNVISALIGLMVGVVLEEPLKRLNDILINHVRNLFRTETPIPTPIPFQFAFGPIETTEVIVDGDGQAEYTPETIVCHYDPLPLPLPPEIEKIKCEIAGREAAKKQSGEPYMWNGLTYALRRYTRGRTPLEEHPELNLWFGPSDWFTHCATSLSLDSEEVLDPNTSRRLTLREKYFANVDWSSPGLQPVPLFSNTFGVAVSLVSGDGRMIIVKRSHEVTSFKGVYNVAINEGVQRLLDRSDRSNVPNLYRTVIRGAAEELGLELYQSDVTFFGFGANVKYSMWAIYGVAHTDRITQEIIDMRRLGAMDKWEGTEIIPIDFDVRTVIEFVDTHRPWSPAALASMYYTLVHEFGKKTVEESISRYMY